MRKEDEKIKKEAEEMEKMERKTKKAAAKSDKPVMCVSVLSIELSPTPS